MNQVSQAAACCGEAGLARGAAGPARRGAGGVPGKPGALIPVLQIAQGIFGYLPEDVLKRVALKLGKSYSEVAGVVGFYSFSRPCPGESTSCGCASARPATCAAASWCSRR